MNGLIKDKFRAAGIHLLISLFLALICFLLVYLVWYPSPLVKATGVGGLFLMMLGIDLVLGPAFTFIVYKKLKKTLKLDLCIIAIIQLSAMIYGVYSMYEGRPVWIAFAGDRFESVRANEVIINSDHYKAPLLSPEYIDVETKPKTAKEQLDMMLSEAQSNISPAQQSKYHRSFDFAKAKIAQKAMDLAELKKYNDSNDINHVLQKYPQATAWLPLKASVMDMVVLVNQQKGEVIKIVDLRPWN
ncbi:TfpX/TfpZ family type IV pilin accessory protein [Acinetobacter sp. YH01022]|uniref:TfpX/TfpZ family type IV pilin accessory protein n=1 Tax=Acinetobacter sp. YH01022 TaxID=2601036 RepID=UPI0015D1E9A7|nr:TfpX/TfpZ family type IV pilin accessory protein [Acinetobacter sp. YH01022]